jgi:hypothetical protein
MAFKVIRLLFVFIVKLIQYENVTVNPQNI